MMKKLSRAETQNFRQVYEDNQLFVRKSLYWVTGRDSVDEIVQEVFVKIWKALPKFKGNSNIKTWVYRITMNTAYDYLKKESKHNKKQERAPSIDVSTPESELVIERLTKEAFQQLSKKQKDVFLLYYIQGLSIEDVANITEVAKGTVKSRLSSSRLIVEKILVKHGVKL